MIENSQNLQNFYNGRRIFVTGHTGFKGSWLCEWLLQLGSHVGGFSLDIPTSPSHYEILRLKDRVHDFRGDIRHKNSISSAIKEFKPEIVFHLAAQPLVRRSFEEPLMTFESNAMGTMYVLESVRTTDSVSAAVFITSDKCYRNAEWTWGYRENDVLGGKDPYSASKGCAELIIYSYIKSFLKNNTCVASARAGNVIGGGDWALDRIAPDAVQAWGKNKSVVIRQPEATRPWQHVLEPLSGYLCLGMNLFEKNKMCVGEAFNFGPDSATNKTVESLLKSMSLHWPEKECRVTVKEEPSKKESTLLKLCCDKALVNLDWRSVLTFEETVEMTATWYRIFYLKGPKHAAIYSGEQISLYMKKAKKRGLSWAL